MRREVEALITQLCAKYRVRERFLGEIIPLVEKIYSGKFSEVKRQVLISLAEDAFRREQEIFDQQVQSAQALNAMCDELQTHYQQVVAMQKDLSDAVESLTQKRPPHVVPVNRLPFGPDLN